MPKKTGTYILLLLILCLLSFYFYSDTITLFPSFIHAWTQSDRYALGLAFLDNGMNLFKPQTFNLMTREGVTGVDLPWHEYIIAWIMKISGNQEPVVFRTYTLLYSFAGYFFLYRLTQLFGSSPIRGFIITVFTFTLPVLVYYQAGFVPSAPALSTAFIAFYFYFRYQKHDRLSDFYLSLLFFTAAALYRSPYNIFLFATLLQQGLKALQHKKLFLKEAAGYAAAYGLIICWHFYKVYLNMEYGSMFLTTLMPAKDLGEFLSLLERIKQNWQWSYFTAYHYILLLLSTVALLIFLIRRKSYSRLRVVLSQQVILTLAGAGCYFLLMMRQFPDHDYYIIDSFYPGMVLLLLLGLTTIPLHKLWQKWVMGLLAVGLLSAAAYESKKIQQERYTFHFWDRGEITRQNFQDADLFLDSLGIPSSARILVLDAYSTNAPLILMNRRGYTVQNTTRENLQKSLENDFDYIVIQDVFLPSDVIRNYPALINHLKRIGGNGRISVFQYSPEPLQQELNDLLDIPESAKIFPLGFENDSIYNHWEFDIPVIDTAFAGEHAGFMKSENLFGPTFVLENQRPRNVLFRAHFMHATPSVNFEVVVNISHKGEQLFYRSFPVHLQKQRQWQEYYCLFTLPADLPENIQLKCNLYNPGGAQVYMDDLSVTLY